MFFQPKKPHITDLKDEMAIKKRDKLIDDDLIARATLLHNMKENIIPLFEYSESTKEIIEALEAKCGPKSDTGIQLLLDKYNCSRMNESECMEEYVN